MLTFLLTWLGGFIAAYFSYQPGKKGLHGLFMLPGLFAPVIAALILVRGDSLLFGYTESSLLF